MGYKIDLVVFQFRDVTHIAQRVSSKEFRKPTIVDLDEIVDANSRCYEIGEHWCINTVGSVNSNG